MSERQPAGTVSQRADGGVWIKPTTTAKEWKQVRGPDAGAGAKGARPTPDGKVEQPGTTVERPWAAVQARYQLDGFLPPEECAPQHVQIDAEGDIDVKPVLLWKDATGAARRTYTERFHWNRHANLHEQTKPLTDKVMEAMKALGEKAQEGDEAALAALLSLRTGQPPSAILSLHPEHTHVARETVKPDAVAKGCTDTLRQILDSTLRLRDLTKLCHWNVEGALFSQLHLLFDQQAEDLTDASDELAERLRAKQLQVTSATPATPVLPTDSLAMVEMLKVAHEALAELCNKGAFEADSEGDAGTVDLLGKRVVAHDKAAWMLRVTAGLAKGGATTDRAHPDRAHFLFKHPRGHAYATSVSDPQLADHVWKRRQEGGDKVFSVSESDVSSQLASAGLGAVDPRAVQHHTITMLAADFLSKTPQVDLRAEGLGAAYQHVRACSDHLAEHFGHAPLPPTMSFVPPAVALGYLEDLGAHHLFPKSFAALKGEPVPEDPKTKAKQAVLKAYGTLDGHEDKVERVYRNILKKAKNAPCSPTEDEPSLIWAPATSSPPLDQPSSTPTTSEPTPTTPGPSSPPSGSSPPSPPALAEAPVELEESLEKAGYLARLAPPSGDRRARYVSDPAAFAALLESGYAEGVVQPGTKFKCPWPNTSGDLVDGYICVDDRQGRLVRFTHDGTGQRASAGVDDIVRLLVEYHALQQKARLVAVREFPELDLGKVMKALSTYWESVEADPEVDARRERHEAVGEVLSIFGSKPTAQQTLEAKAKAAYLTITKRVERGELDDRVFRSAAIALLQRDYEAICNLAKGDVGAVHSTTDAPRGMPVGAQTQRKDGEYRKEGQHDWHRVPSHGAGKAVSAPAEALHKKLSKLKSEYKSAPADQKDGILDRIAAINQKLKRLKAKPQATTQKAATVELNSMRADLDRSLDPIDTWLAKGHSFVALDTYMTDTVGGFEGFVEDLAVAPPTVRMQATLLRTTQGPNALRERFQKVTRK